ncbi:MAG: hypothetical protein A3J06_03835 [Candidatus Moranbacteria bacterium RIFCSPLOWO2_02_FULL_48_19]|nr:MAG: hypothetical protein A3J06_03835 [Candidatus Moranbacteria bacterium RIFCSPLOWO2_02_FULL_48_19]OGI31299.1 MAG: hypothetical protein A3G09_00275 [Candidatus Moranbacteria bacterium RIFCSPLOWO2_12_FULL_48_12]
MPYSFLEHTADVRMRVTGDSPEGLFRDALFGMVSLMSPETKKEGEKIRRKIALDAPDRTALLIDFLNEALVWMHTESEAYTEVRFHTLGERKLEAELEGERVAGFGEDIKAATYHEAEVGKDPTGT